MWFLAPPIQSHFHRIHVNASFHSIESSLYCFYSVALHSQFMSSIAWQIISWVAPKSDKLQGCNTWITDVWFFARLSHCYFFLAGAVGLYVPGGTAVLPSSTLMLAVPAGIAGCKTIVMATPPRPDGSITPEVLYCAKKAGVTHILKAGGAQAVAAMAWGTESCPKVIYTLTCRA